jgi:hypothetical protein
LGDFNDLAVQQEHLFEAIQNVSYRSKAGKNTVLALSYLTGKLNERQQTIKNNFARSFLNYSDSKVQKIFNDLFCVEERQTK